MVDRSFASRSLRTRHVLSALLAGAIVAGSHGAASADLETSFAVISIGASREMVVLLLGQPTTQTETTTLGISHTKLRWQPSSRSPAFVVTFVLGRVVSKTQCGNPSEC